jgi:catechol 2,3-dioxygenase
MNVWRSRGAGLRQPTLGLRDVSIILPNTDDLGTIAERLTHAKVEVRNDGQIIRLDDPWGNQVSLTASA